MRIYSIILFLLLYLSGQTNGQNLVNNPSFELKNSCPVFVSDIKAPFQDLTVIGWYNVGVATSDYYNSCHKTGYVGVPENVIGWQQARTGEAYAGFYASNIFPILGEYREYLQTKLQSTLQKDHVYAVKFWISLAEKANSFPETGILDYVDDIGAYFVPDYLTGRTGYDNSLIVNPQVVHNGGALKDTLQWMEVSGTFTAKGDEQWMVIGRFAPSAWNPSFKAYYFIDDVCVADITNVISVYDTTLCQQEGVTELHGRDSARQYFWNTGDTSKSITISQSGTYWVRSSNDCAYWIDTFHTTLDNHRLDLGDDIMICTPFSLPLNVDTSFSDYLWSTGDSSYQIIVSQSGTYTVSARSNFCFLTDTIQITERNPHLVLWNNKDTVVCEGAEIQIRADGAVGQSYLWSPSIGVSDSLLLEPVISITQSATYTLTATYPGCPDTSVSINVTMQYKPRIDLGPDKVACEGKEIAIEPHVTPYRNDYLYTWEPFNSSSQSNNNPNIHFIADTSSTYKITVTSPAGCTSSESIAVTMIPKGFGDIISDTGYCPPGVVELWATGGESYQWEPAYGLNDAQISNPIASPATSTNYKVYIKDENACIDTQLVSVQIYPLAVLQLPDSITIYPGEEYQIEPRTNALYFEWFPPSGVSDTKIADPILNPKVRTRYFVTATTEHGCALIDSVDILISETVIDMPNAFTPGRGINNEFKVSKRGIAQLNEFSIFNRWGERVFTTKDIEKGWNGTYKDQPQPLGVYIYIIYILTDDGRIFRLQGNVTLLR